MSESAFPIIQPDSVRLIAQSAPGAYDSNMLSLTRCSEAGRTLLDQIKLNGMSDELDRACAVYLDKARRTLKAMNERRAPVTKLFDQIRTAFTSMEATVDAAKPDSLPHIIQQHRNRYAAAKLREAERIRQEELRARQRQLAVSRYVQDIETALCQAFDAKLSADIDTLAILNATLTVDNFDTVSARIISFPVALPDAWLDTCPIPIPRPAEVTPAEADAKRLDTIRRFAPQFRRQYARELADYRDTLTDALPAKRKALIDMAAASASEAARIKADLDAREAAHTARLDAERTAREAEQRAAADLKAQAVEMDSLFNEAAVATPAYQPKAAVKHTVVPHDADGILAIVSMWWSKEGQHLPLPELEKIFRKQIAYVNRLANHKDTPEFIQSPSLHYTEEVKAK